MKRQPMALLGALTDMFFHVEERQAWLRWRTHTIVFDRDPDFARFAQDPTGRRKRLLRIWLAEPGAGRPYLRAYLGTVTFCATGPSFPELCRLFRFTSKAAADAGQPASCAAASCIPSAATRKRIIRPGQAIRPA